MTLSNAEIMKSARSQLQGRWKPVLLLTLVYFLVGIIPGSMPKIGFLFSLILGGPFTFGLSCYFLKFTRNTNPELEELFKGFSIFGKTFIAYLLMVVFTLLWAILLIVPGIIAAFSYSMTFYIMADNKEMSAQDAIRKSKELMTGNKYRYFRLICRFIGWFLLGIVTIGIGFLWIMPYFMVSNTRFYESLIQPENTQVNPM